jgi:hypothetical protein
MEMDEDETNDVPIDEQPELDPSELLDLEFDEDEDADDINTEDVDQAIPQSLNQSDAISTANWSKTVTSYANSMADLCCSSSYKIET